MKPQRPEADSESALLQRLAEVPIMAFISHNKESAVKLIHWLVLLMTYLSVTPVARSETFAGLTFGHTYSNVLRQVPDLTLAPHDERERMEVIGSGNPRSVEWIMGVARYVSNRPLTKGVDRTYLYFWRNKLVRIELLYGVGTPISHFVSELEDSYTRGVAETTRIITERLREKYPEFQSQIETNGLRVLLEQGRWRRSGRHFPGHDASDDPLEEPPRLCVADIVVSATSLDLLREMRVLSDQRRERHRKDLKNSIGGF